MLFPPHCAFMIPARLCLLSQTLNPGPDPNHPPLGSSLSLSILSCDLPVSGLP